MKWLIFEKSACFIYFLSYSDFQCARQIREASQKCMDCSSHMIDAIVCITCAVKCHSGHTLVPIPTHMCRCVHKNPKKASSWPKSLETCTGENSPLLSQHISLGNNSKTQTTTMECGMISFSAVIRILM